MGAAPSAETLRTAPFCPMRKGSRQLALLPFTQEFFPNARSPLFLQLYEAYMDSSVRYYIRREGGSLLQDRIPPIAFTIEELYARYKAVSSSSYYPTNQALREEVEAGRGYRVRPTPCAVVFLYEGKGPEGCARVLKQKSMQIRVIGAVGDALCEPSTTPIVLRESDVFRYQIFITKSAGDHNLVRVQLIAAHVYQYQCLELIGLREVPFLPTTMLTLKTNIPFLCFFRELRGRTHSLWGPSTTLSMWVDDACLRVSASADSMRAICAAFAKHFMIIKEKKSNHRKLRQKGEKDSRKRPLTSSLTEVGSFSSLTDSCEEAGALVPAESSIPFNHAIAMSNKVTYQLKGYIVEKEATIVAGCGAPNEVYVVCTDSVIQVVAPIEGEGKGEGEGEAGGRASVVLTKGVSLTASAIPTKPVVEAGEGSPPSPPHPAPLAAAEDDEETARNARETPTPPLQVLYVLHAARGDVLSFTPFEEEEGEEPARAKEAKPGAEAADPLPESNPRLRDDHAPLPSPSLSLSRPGRWRIDPGIFMECILLSLVRDECKRAREAAAEDPNWVLDPLTHRPVHQDSFYIWRFRRGREVFFYGTVPKFANPKQGGKAAGAGAGGVGVGGGGGGSGPVEEPNPGGDFPGGFGARENEGGGGGGSAPTPPARRGPPRYAESTLPLYQGPLPPIQPPFLYEVKQPAPCFGYGGGHGGGFEGMTHPDKSTPVHVVCASQAGTSPFQVLSVSPCSYEQQPPSSPVQYMLVKMPPSQGQTPILYSTTVAPTPTPTAVPTTVSMSCVSTPKIYPETSMAHHGYSTSTYYCLTPTMPSYLTPNSSPSLVMTSGHSSSATCAYSTVLSQQLPMQVVMLQPPSK